MQSEVPAVATVWRFDDVEFDGGAYRVTRAGENVAVEPQVMNVLRYLIEHRDRVVPKEELLDEVWGDRFVSESALTSRIKSVRKCVGDDGRAQRVIRTVHGRGYQFVAVIDGQPIAPTAVAPAAVQPDTIARVSAPASETVGRQRLLATLAERLTTGRLLTLVGPGGVGKTHLARQAAADLADRFRDGCWFVDFTNVRDASSLGMAVLDTLGEPQHLNASPEQTAVATLEAVEGLLVLDNCEHVLEGAAAFVNLLTTEARTMTIVATSRQRLGVSGELVLDVPVLDSESGARLFSTRADEHGVDVGQHSAVVREICDRLDNLPLAIELASAQTRMLDVRQLSDLLDERLSLLTGTPGGGGHHQTLEQTIAASFDALDPSLQQTLCRFSVFAGSFGLVEATSLARRTDVNTQIEAVRHIVDLAERSLIVVEDGHSEQTYRLLESVRLFAAERLAEPEVVKGEHIDLYRDRAERRHDVLNGSKLSEALHDIIADWPNYRAALINTIELGRLGDAAALLAATESYAAAAQRYEHADWARRVLTAAPDPLHADLESVRAGLARFEVFQDFDSVPELLASLDDLSLHLGALEADAYHSFLSGDRVRADERLQAMIDTTEGTGGLDELSACSTSVFLRSTNPGTDLESPLERLRKVAPRHGSFGAAFQALAEARLAFRNEDVATTIRECSRCLALAEEHGLGILVLGAARARSMGLASHDDLKLVAEQLIDSLERYRSRGHWTTATVETPLVARVLLDTGHVESAARLLGAYSSANYAVSWSAELAGPLIDLIRAEHPEHVAAMELGPSLTGADLCSYSLDRLNEVLPSLS